jgi:hypothetical protein
MKRVARWVHPPFFPTHRTDQHFMHGLHGLHAGRPVSPALLMRAVGGGGELAGLWPLWPLGGSGRRCGRSKSAVRAAVWTGRRRGLRCCTSGCGLACSGGASVQHWCSWSGGAELASARDGDRRASARMVVARGWPIQAAVVGHLWEKSLLRLGQSWRW